MIDGNATHPNLQMLLPEHIFRIPATMGERPLDSSKSAASLKCLSATGAIL